MAENFSDFCCPSTRIIVLFLLYFALSGQFFVRFLFYSSYQWSVSRLSYSIGSIIDSFSCSVSLMICTVAGRLQFNQKLLMVRWFMPFVRVVQFSQSVSCSSSAVHGSCRSFVSSCSSVAGSVGLVVQSICTVCIIAGADQLFPAQTTKHDSRLLGFFTIMRHGAKLVYKLHNYI